MPELRLEPLAHEHEYILDQAGEFGDIDSGAGQALRLYGEKARIGAIIEGGDIGHGVRRRQITRALGNYGYSIIDSMNVEDQGAFYALSFAHIRHDAVQLVPVLAEWAISDRVEGGCMEKHNYPMRCERDFVTPWKRDIRRLHSPAWIRRYVKRDDSCRFHRERANNLIHRAACVPKQFLRDGWARFESEYARQREHQRDLEQRQWHRVHQELAMGVSYSDAIQDPLRVTIKPKLIGKFRKKRRAYQKVLRRSSVTATAFLGTEVVRDLLQSKSIVISGKELDFEVQPSAALGSKGHGVLDIAALDKSGSKLADLCVYFEDTPALDQVTALKINVDAGLEMEILQTANIIRMTADGEQHSAIAEKRRAAIANMISTDTHRIIDADTGHVVPPDPKELRLARNETYFKETQHIWDECVKVFVFGRHVETVYQ